MFGESAYTEAITKMGPDRRRESATGNTRGNAREKSLALDGVSRGRTGLLSEHGVVLGKT